MNLLLVMTGAAFGGVLRYGVGTAVQARFGAHFPLGTLVVNVSGCFLIGVLMEALERARAHSNWGLFLVTGLLGGYTTFSTFGWETYVLLREGLLTRGLLNALLSAATGCAAVWCGVAAVRFWR